MLVILVIKVMLVILLMLVILVILVIKVMLVILVIKVILVILVLADVVVDQEVFWPQGRLHICQKLHEKLQLKEARLGGSLAPEEDFPLSDDATT